MQNQPPAAKNHVTPERIMQFAFGYAPPLILEAAVRFGVFDLLDKGPRTVQEVQAASKASHRGLLAIMNALAGLGFMEKDAQSRYSLTPESQAFLVTGKPGFLGGLIRHTSTQLIPNWLHLADVVATGKPPSAVNEQGDGSEFFAQFVEDLFPMSHPAALNLARELNLAKAAAPFQILDLAAGSGVWGIVLAGCNPAARVTAVDWPKVIPVTRKMAAKFGLENRMSYIEGDILEVDYGSGYRLATLGHILHSEGETRSRALLKKTFAALAPGGTIAIAEFLTNAEHTCPPQSLIFAVNMLVNTTEGGTYSFEEISEWLREAGFTNARLLESPGPSPLVLASKPG